MPFFSASEYKAQVFWYMRLAFMTRSAYISVIVIYTFSTPQ